MDKLHGIVRIKNVLSSLYLLKTQLQMVIRIPKDAPASAVDDALKAIANQPKSARKGFDPTKYAGKIKFPMDGLTYQKKVRDEWE